MAENSDKATIAQIETITKQAGRLYKGSASTLIEIAGNYPLLNAIGKGDVPAAQKEISAMIAKRQSEIAAFKANKGTTKAIAAK